MVTPSDILRVLSDRGTCSAEDLATALGCTTEDTLRVINNQQALGGLGLAVQKLAGPRGVLYRVADWQNVQAYGVMAGEVENG